MAHSQTNSVLVCSYLLTLVSDNTLFLPARQPQEAVVASVHVCLWNVKSREVDVNLLWICVALNPRNNYISVTFDLESYFWYFFW